MMSEYEHLFVYGTLRKDSQHIMGKILANKTINLGKARVRGRLYNLIEFPGAVDNGGEDDWIYGELYQLINPSDTLPMLDDYEGCGPEATRPYIFERYQVDAYLENDEVYTAWIYWYRGNFHEQQRVISGDYLTEQDQ